MKISAENGNYEQTNALNVLRIIFILCIIVFHTKDGLCSVGLKVYQFISARGGYLGNIWFFMLAGFVTELNYRNRIIDGELSVTQYVIRSLRRIYPLYIITTGVMIILNIINENYNALSFKSILLNITLTTSGWVDDVYPLNVPGWFLSQLLLMKLLYFLSARLFGKRGFLSTIYIVYMTAGYALLGRNLNFPFLYNHNAEGLLYFYSGCLLCVGFNFSTREQRKYVIASCVPITVIYILFAWKQGIDTALGSFPIFLMSLVYPLIFILTLDVSALNKFLSNNEFLQRTAKLTMPLYLWHVPIANIFSKMIAAGLLKKGAVTLIAYYVTIFVISWMTVNIGYRLHHLKSNKASRDIL